MPLSRRLFLRRGTLTALAAGCALGSNLKVFGRSPLRPNPSPADELFSEAVRGPVFQYSRQTFEPYVGGTFRGSNGGGPVYLKLLRVSDYNPAAGTRLATGAAPATKSFRLTFRAGHRLSPNNSVHQLEHPDLGPFSLFMTRHIDPRGQVFYDAVINHVA